MHSESSTRRVQCVCIHCQAPFTTIPSRIREGRGRYCSKACFDTHRRIAIEDKYRARVVQHGPDECWGWNGTHDPDGYGTMPGMGIRARPPRAHRVSWEIYRGSIPPKMQVLHTCDVRDCSNPAHLFLGTNADNMADRNAKGRQARGERSGSYLHPDRVPRGEANGIAKLTAERVRTIRRRYVPRGHVSAIPDGASGRRLAIEYGVTPALISAVIHRRVWMHI